MLRVALRNVRAHLVRLGLSILAVVLGVSFVSGTFSLREMLSSTFTGIVDAGYQADAYLRGAEGGTHTTQEGASAGDVRTPVPAALAETAAALDEVDHAFADVTGPIVVVGEDGTAVTSAAGAPSFALAWYADDPTLTLTEGRAPSGADEFALETASAESTGLDVGDTTTLVVGGQITEATLTGIADMGTALAGATVVLLDPETATEVYAPDGLVESVSVYAAAGVSETELVALLDDALAAEGTAGVETVTGDALRTEARTDIESQLGFVETFLLVFAGISLFVGGFIIANTFAMTVRQRQREFALLRAVGASPLQVFASILVQAAVVGLVGGALGVAGGLGLVTALKALFESMGMDLAGDVPVTTQMVVVSLVVGLVVSVVSAALPARRAALVPPVEAMRDESPGQARSLRVRGVLGLVVAGAGTGAVVAAVVRAAGDDAASTGPLLGAGAVGVVLGVLLLAPVMARAVLGVLAAPFVLALKPVGRLARGNVTRNPRRTASTASALMIGMALVGAASVLAASTQASLSSSIRSEAIADLVVQSATFVVPAGAVTEIGELPEVGAVDTVTVGRATITEAGQAQDADAASATEPSYVVGLTDGTFGRSLTGPTIDGDVDTLTDGMLAVRTDEADENGWAVGDELTLTSQSGTVTAPVGAVIDSETLGTPVVMSEDLLLVIEPKAQEQVETVLLTAADGVDVADLKEAVTGAAAPYVILTVLDEDEFVSQIAAEVDQVLVILYALLALSIVIAILGIVNTLALSVIERTREIGLMRAVGLGRLQLAATITVESVLTAVFGTVVGLGVGVALAAGMPTVFAEVGFNTLVIPWGELALMLGIAVAVGVLAALWPAVRAARLPVLDAVTVD
ncbi:ABC transporter permease [Sanguibacter suaedae]|uniref:ABC transporter permease n=1 Tax=Sanguibacter suaedae TaxID=2795737 RepID=A0A934MAQ3_9MICO|nr:ABC transporter permease [Sanguibacter suaedae]MBI9116023.1 ABC transporter permease [Sanguibacter suaedae]